MCEIQMSLRNDLKTYGLNPSEWTLRKLKKQKFKVVHVKDNTFYFVGKTQQRGPLQQWTTLQLISI